MIAKFIFIGTAAAAELQVDKNVCLASDGHIGSRFLLEEDVSLIQYGISQKYYKFV